MDAGPLVALLAKRDAAHALCTDYFSRLRLAPVTTWPVLTEAAWMLRSIHGAVPHLFRLAFAGSIRVAHLDAAAFAWIPEFMARYASMGVQLADASLMYIAERDGHDTIFSLDRRDFSVYRLRSGRPLELVPDPLTY